MGNDLSCGKLQVHTSDTEVPLFVERVPISPVFLRKLSVSFKDKLVLVIPLWSLLGYLGYLTTMSELLLQQTLAKINSAI